MCNFEFESDATWLAMVRCKSLFESVSRLGFVSDTTLYFLYENDLVDAFNAHCDMADKTELIINVGCLHDSI